MFCIIFLICCFPFSSLWSSSKLVLAFSKLSARASTPEIVSLHVCESSSGKSDSSLKAPVSLRRSSPKCFASFCASSTAATASSICFMPVVPTGSSLSLISDAVLASASMGAVKFSMFNMTCLICILAFSFLVKSAKRLFASSTFPAKASTSVIICLRAFRSSSSNPDFLARARLSLATNFSNCEASPCVFCTAANPFFKLDISVSSTGNSPRFKSSAVLANSSIGVVRSSMFCLTCLIRILLSNFPLTLVNVRFALFTFSARAATSASASLCMGLCSSDRSFNVSNARLSLEFFSSKMYACLCALSTVARDSCRGAISEGISLWLKSDAVTASSSIAPVRSSTFCLTCLICESFSSWTFWRSASSSTSGSGGLASPSSAASGSGLSASGLLSLNSAENCSRRPWPAQAKHANTSAVFIIVIDMNKEEQPM
mmetsp:Transcript_29201/g.53715  ORF Transcript_29201/g.53715 Transcript_29201/m.53715 type:complete len:431 (+) Transcript_29201:409-1701(+)